VNEQTGQGRKRRDRGRQDRRRGRIWRSKVAGTAHEEQAGSERQRACEETGKHAQALPPRTLSGNASRLAFQGTHYRVHAGLRERPVGSADLADRGDQAQRFEHLLVGGST